MHNSVMRDRQYELLVHHCNEIDDEEALQRMSSGYLKVKSNLIQESFDLFRTYDIENRNEMRNSILLTHDQYEEAERRYTCAMSKINNKLEVLVGRHETSIDSDVARIIRVETAMPPKLIQFDGDPAKWPAFHDLFVAQVHSRDIDPVGKLLYLQEYCTGKAAATLGVWQPTAESYESAWELLNKTYSDKYQIRQGIIDNIFQMEKMKEESHDGLRAILDTVNSSLRQLKV